MRTNIPYNILTISEMNKTKNNIRKENIEYDSMILDAQTIKKLRASSSMFNKSVFVKINKDYLHYNVESIHKNSGIYTIMLISSDDRLELRGSADTHPEIISSNS
ncbi:hypothetical protein FACS1894105_03290 [Clostridia bacterium]|nr:hypothetical protein FACS1894105_03290 [Clostridia bacterium]